MSAKPTVEPELVEPLRNFLETFTQELTEQRFVPAFRNELGRLLTGLEGLQQAEDTLQQIAKGVDRLRDIFAPAGTKLLEGVKEFEAAIRASTGQLRQQTDGVLQDLLKTHAQLEAALHAETEPGTGKSAVSREALGRTIADVEERLAGLNTQVDRLCQRLEGRDVAAVGTAVTVSAGGGVGPDLRELLSRSEQAITERLERYQQDVRGQIEKEHGADRKRLESVEQRITEVLSGSQPGSGLDMDRLIDRIEVRLQALLAAEVESHSHRARSDGKTPPAAAETASAVATVEKHLLKELSLLSRDQQDGRSETKKFVADLARGFEEISVRYAERAETAGTEVRGLLRELQTSLGKLNDSARRHEEEWNTLTGSQKELHDQITAQSQAALHKTTEHIQSLFAQHTKEQDLLARIASAVSHADEAAQHALTDVQSQQARITGNLQELNSLLSERVTAERLHLEETLRQTASAELEALQGLRQSLQDVAAAHQSAISDAASQLGTVAHDISELRAGQTKSVSVLSDAIRANYDVSSQRLKEIIEQATERFALQIAQVPEALERYSHLVQSLNQGNHLALQGISSDTRNLVSLSNEKFELILTDTSGIKKFFPILDRKLEKQAAELDQSRKAQARLEKDQAELKNSIERNRAEQMQQQQDLRADVGRFRSASEERIAAARSEIAELSASLGAMAETTIPALRRDLTALLTSKFEFIEQTLHERQDLLRKEMAEREEQQQRTQKKMALLMGLLITLSVVLQLVFHYTKTPGAGQ